MTPAAGPTAGRRTSRHTGPALSAAPDGEPGEWLPGILLRGVRSLPVRW